MEIVLEVLFEFFGEIILQVVFEALTEAGLHFLKRPQPTEPPAPWKLVLGYIVLGLVVGGISLLIVPGSFLHSEKLRIANLVLAPIASGFAMVFIGKLRIRRGQTLLAVDRFSYGFIFAFAMAAVRFHWAH